MCTGARLDCATEIVRYTYTCAQNPVGVETPSWREEENRSEQNPLPQTHDQANKFHPKTRIVADVAVDGDQSYLHLIVKRIYEQTLRGP